MAARWRWQPLTTTMAQLAPMLKHLAFIGVVPVMLIFGFVSMFGQTTDSVLDLLGHHEFICYGQVTPAGVAQTAPGH